LQGYRNFALLSNRHKHYKQEQIDFISILPFWKNAATLDEYMLYPQFHKRISKVCALLLATALLPVLAYAGTDNGNGNGGQNNGNQNGHNKGDVPTVPDGGPGIVLMITAFGAVLLFGAIQRSRTKA
jgi:hypothetical protein